METIIELAEKLKAQGFAKSESPFSFGNRVLCEIRNELGLTPIRTDNNRACYSPSDIGMMEEEFFRLVRAKKYYDKHERDREIE